MDLGDLTAMGRGTAVRRALIEDLDAGDRVDVVAEPHAVARAERPGEHAHQGDPLAARPALDLEHRSRRRAGVHGVGCGQQRGDRVQDVVDADAPQGDAEVHRHHPQPRRLVGDRLAQSVGRDRRPVDVAPQDRVVVAASTSMAASTNAGSSVRRAVTVARSVPTPDGVAIARTSTARRPAMAASVPRSSAPTRSSLFTNTIVGTPSRRRARNSTSVCACTPSTADTTRTAPSSTPRTRSTSAMKSGCPGVSIRLIVTPSTTNDTTADLIVIPR